MKTRCQWARICSKLNAFRRDPTCHNHHSAGAYFQQTQRQFNSKHKEVFVHLWIQFHQPLALKAAPCTQACLTWEYLTCRHCTLACFSKKKRRLHFNDATPYAKCAKTSGKVQSMQAKSWTQNNHRRYPKQSNSHSITARNIAKHMRTDRVTLSNVWAMPGLEEATLNNMQVSSENTQVHPKFGNGHDGEFAGLSGSG